MNRTSIKACFITLLWLPVFAMTAQAQQLLPYERDYPAINYYDAEPSGQVVELFAAIRAGDLSLRSSGEHLYLESLLEALQIDSSSQLLVYSKTARKRRFISPENPRVLYFNDEVYVGVVPGTDSIEIAAMDPTLGPVFFDIPQTGPNTLNLTRQTTQCLRCHDTRTNSGGGTPRFMMSSVLVDADGNIASHEVSVITGNSTPLDRRWGGWYVTGLHGDQPTMGNLIYRPGQAFASIDLLANGNKTELPDVVDADAYLTPYSDIVALLVMQHQIDVQNTMTRVSWEYRQQLAEQGSVDETSLESMAAPLVDALLMANEAALGDEIEGVSGFTEYFQALGPRDAQGRSLRELDLGNRVFRYPLSYLIYSEAFAALPAALHDHVVAKLHEILGAASDPVDYPYLDAQTRADILAIVEATAPGFFP